MKRTTKKAIRLEVKFYLLVIFAAASGEIVAYFTGMDAPFCILFVLIAYVLKQVMEMRYQIYEQTDGHALDDPAEASQTSDQDAL